MPTNKKTAVLLVDDWPANIEVLESMLAGFDLAFLTASNGLDALQLLEGNEVAVALVDVRMPGMDGFELLNRIRSRTDPPPVILVTAAYAARETVLESYSAGSVDFLYKPLEPTVLRAKVKIFVDLFRRRKSREALAKAALDRQAGRSESTTLGPEEQINQSLDLLSDRIESLSRQPQPLVLDYWG